MRSPNSPWSINCELMRWYIGRLDVSNMHAQAREWARRDASIFSPQPPSSVPLALFLVELTSIHPSKRLEKHIRIPEYSFHFHKPHRW